MKQLEKKVIGTKPFGPKMDITDPWYDKEEERNAYISV